MTVSRPFQFGEETSFTLPAQTPSAPNAPSVPAHPLDLFGNSPPPTPQVTHTDPLQGLENFRLPSSAPQTPNAEPSENQEGFLNSFLAATWSGNEIVSSFSEIRSEIAAGRDEVERGSYGVLGQDLLVEEEPLHGILSDSEARTILSRHARSFRDGLITPQTAEDFIQANLTWIESHSELWLFGAEIESRLNQCLWALTHNDASRRQDQAYVSNLPQLRERVFESARRLSAQIPAWRERIQHRKEEETQRLYQNLNSTTHGSLNTLDRLRTLWRVFHLRKSQGASGEEQARLLSEMTELLPESAALKPNSPQHIGTEDENAVLWFLAQAETEVFRRSDLNENAEASLRGNLLFQILPRLAEHTKNLERSQPQLALSLWSQIQRSLYHPRLANASMINNWEVRHGEPRRELYFLERRLSETQNLPENPTARVQHWISLAESAKGRQDNFTALRFLTQAEQGMIRLENPETKRLSRGILVHAYLRLGFRSELQRLLRDWRERSSLAGIRRNLQGFEEWISIAQIFAENHENSEAKEIFNFARGFLSHWDLRRRIAAYPALLQLARRIENTNAPQEILDAALEDLNRAPAFRNIQERMSLIVGLAQAVSTPQEALNLLQAFLPASQLRDFEIHSETDLQVAQNYSAQLLNLWNRIEDGATRHQIANRLRDFFNQTRVVRGNLSAENFHTLQRNFLQNRIILETQARSLSIEAVPDSHNDLSNFLLALPLQERVTHLIESARFFAEHGKETESALLLRALWNDLENTPLEQRFALIQQISNLRTSLSANLRESIRREPEEERALQDLVENLKQMGIDAWRSVQNSANQRTGAVNGAPPCLLSRYAQAMIEVEEGNEPEALRLLQSLLRDSEQTPLESEQDRRIVVLARLMVRGSASQHFESVALILEQVLEARQAGAVEMNRLERFREKTELLNILRAIRQFQHRHSEGSAALTFREAFTQFQNDPHHQAEAQYFIEHISRLGGIETPSLMLPQGALWDFLVAADGNLQSQEGRQAFEQAIRNFTRFDADYFQTGEYQQALHTAIEILRSRSSAEELWHLNTLPGWVAGNEETGAFVRRLFSWETGLALTGMILAGAAGGMAQGWVIQMLEQGYMGETMIFEGFEALQWARMGISINNTVRAAQFVPQFFGAFGNIGGFWFGSGTWDTVFQTGGFNDIRATAVDIGPMGILLAPFATWGAIPRCLISSLVMPLTGTARHYLNLTHEGETLEHTWNVFEFLHGMAIGLGSEAVSHFNAHARGGSPEHQTLRQQREQTERIHRLVEQLSGTSHLQDLPPTPSFVRRGEGEVETSPSHPYRSAASTEATAKTDSQATGHTDPHLKILQALHRLAEQIPLHELSDAQIRYAIREALKAEEAHARRNPETAEHANPFPEILHRYLEALRRGVRPEDLSRFSDFEHPFEDLIREAHIRNAARAREQALWPEFIHLERLQEEAAQRQIVEDRALFTSIDFEALKHLHIEEQRARIIAGLNPEATTLERVLHAANEWRNKYQGQIPLERVLEAFGVDLETLPRLEIFDTEGEVVSETREALREDEVQETSIVTSPDSVIPRFDRGIQASSQNQMDFRFGGNDTRVGAIHELPLLEATNPVQDAEGYVSGEVIDARDYGEPASIISSPVTPRIQRPILTGHAELVVVDAVETSHAEIAQTPHPRINAKAPSEVLSFREAKREQQREIQEDLLDVEGIEIETEVSLESEPGEGRSQSSQEFHEDSFTPTANDPVVQAPLDGIRHSLRSFFEAHPIVAAAAGLIFTLGLRYLFGHVHAGISEAGGILDLLLAGNLAVAVNAIKERLSEEYVAFFAEHQDPAHLRLALDLLPQISTHLSPAQLETVMGHLYRLPNTQKARVDLITQRVRAAIRADTGEAKNILRRGLEHADPEIVADHLFAIRLLPSHLVPRDTILAVGELCRRNPNEDVVATLQAIERMRATQNLTPQENVLLAAHLTLAHRAVDTPTLRASLDALIRDRKVDAQKLQAEIARLAPTAPAEEREVAAIRARVLPAEVDAALQEMLTMAEEVSGGFSPENLREVVQKHAASVLEDYPPHYHALFAQHTERLIYFALAYELRERGEFPDPETFNAFLLFIEYKLLDDPRPAILDCGMNHAMRHLAQVQEMFVEAQAYFTEIWRASLNIAQYRNRLSDLREGAEYEETQRRIFAKRVLCLLLERRQFGDRAWEESVAHALGVALVEEGRLPTLETPAGHDDFHITVQDHLNFFDFFSRLLSQRAEQLTTVRNLDHTFPPLARYARSEARVSLRDVEALWKTHLPPRASGEKPVFMLEGVGEEWAQVERHARAGHHVVLVDMRIEAEGYYQQRSAQLRALEAAFGVSIEFHREDLLDPSPAFRERFAGRVDCIECQNIPGLGGNDTQLIDTLLKDGGLFVEFNPLEIRRDALVERAYTRVFSAENVHAVLGTFAERTVYPVGCQIEAWQKSQALRSSQDVSKPTSSIHDLRPTDMTDENLIGVIGLIPNSPKIQGPHNARARETIQAAAQRPGTPITQLLILGAGPCRDIPVEALVASGRDVKLQDLFALEVTATREKFSPTIRNRVTLELSDAYGGILFDLLHEVFRLVNQVDVTLKPQQALAELARLLDATDFENMELPTWAREARPGQMIVSSIMAHQAFFAVWQLCRNYQLNPNTIVGNIRRFIGRSLVFHARALTHATRRGARAYFSLEIADNKLAYVNTFNPDGTTLERVAHLFAEDVKLEAFSPWPIRTTAHSTPMHVEAVVLEPKPSSEVPGPANPADNKGSSSSGTTRATHRHGLQRRGPAHKLARPENEPAGRGTATTPSSHQAIPISTRQKLRRLFIVRAGKLAEINPEIRDLPDTIFNEACERACLEYKLENGNFEQHALRIFERIVFEIIWSRRPRVHRLAPSSLARQTREAAQKPAPAAATPPPPPEPVVKVRPRAPVVDAPPRPNGEEGDRRFLRSLEALDTRKYQALYVEERLAHEREIFAILRFYPAEHVLSRRAKGVLAQTHWEFFEREARRKTSATNQRRAGIDTEDLIQEAALIMLEKAIEGFEPERGNLFATYLEAWVFAAQSRHVKNMGRTVRIPVYLYDLFPKVRHLEAIGKTDREICKELKISQETLEQLRIHRQDTSFSADLPRQSDPERDTRNFYALIPMSETFDPAQIQSYQSLQRALDKIPPRQAEVFIQRFVEGRTLADIAKNQPNGRVTPQRIQDIQTRAIKNLRKVLRNEVDADTRRIIDGLIRTNARRSASRKDSSDAPSVPGTSANSRANGSRSDGITRSTDRHGSTRRRPAHWLHRQGPLDQARRTTETTPSPSSILQQGIQNVHNAPHLPSFDMLRTGLILRGGGSAEAALVQSLRSALAQNDNATPWGHPPLAPAMPAIDIAAGDGFTQAHSPYTPNAALLHEGTQAGVLQFRTRENADRPRAATRDPKASGDTTKGNAHSSGQGSGQQKQSGRHRANPPGPQTHTRNVQRDIAALHRDVDRVYAYLLEWFRTPGEFDLRQDLPDLARHIAETWPEEKIQIQIATGIMGAEHAAFPQMLEHLRRAREIEAAPSSAPSIILDLGPIAPANSAVLREVLHAPAQTLTAPARVPLLARHGGGLKIALEQALPAPLRAEARPLVEAILLDAQATDEPRHRYTQAIHAWVTRFRHALRSALHDPERIVAYLEGRRGVLTPEDRIEIPQVLLYLVGDLTRVSDAELSPLPIDPETLRRNFETAVLAREGEQTAYVLMQTLYGHESMDAVDAHFGGNTSPRHRTLLAVRDYFRTLYGPHLKRLRVTPEPSETAPSNQTRQELPTSNPVLASTGRSQKPFRALLARLDSTGIATAEESHRLYVSSKLPGTNGHSYRTLRTVSETAILARLREMLETDPALAKLEGGIVDDAFDRAYTTYDLSTQDFQGHAVRVFEEMVRAALPAREERADVPPEPPPPPAVAVVAERSPTLPPPPLPAALEPVVTRAEEVSRVHSPVSSEIDSSIRRVAATATHASYAIVYLHEGESIPAGIMRALTVVPDPVRRVQIETSASRREMGQWLNFRPEMERALTSRAGLLEISIIRSDGSALVIKRTAKGVKRVRRSAPRRPWLEPDDAQSRQTRMRLAISGIWREPTQVRGNIIGTGEGQINHLSDLLRRAPQILDLANFPQVLARLEAVAPGLFNISLLMKYVNNPEVSPELPRLQAFARVLEVDVRDLMYLASRPHLAETPQLRELVLADPAGPYYAPRLWGTFAKVAEAVREKPLAMGFALRLLRFISSPERPPHTLGDVCTAIGFPEISGQHRLLRGSDPSYLAVEKFSELSGEPIAEILEDLNRQHEAPIRTLREAGYPTHAALSVLRPNPASRNFDSPEKLREFANGAATHDRSPRFRAAYLVSYRRGRRWPELTLAELAKRRRVKPDTLGDFESIREIEKLNPYFTRSNIDTWVDYLLFLETPLEEIVWAFTPTVESAEMIGQWLQERSIYPDLARAVFARAEELKQANSHAPESTLPTVSGTEPVNPQQDFEVLYATERDRQALLPTLHEGEADLPVLGEEPALVRVILEPEETFAEALGRGLNRISDEKIDVVIETDLHAPLALPSSTHDTVVGHMSAHPSVRRVALRRIDGSAFVWNRRAVRIEREEHTSTARAWNFPERILPEQRQRLIVRSPWAIPALVLGREINPLPSQNTLSCLGDLLLHWRKTLNISQKEAASRLSMVSANATEYDQTTWNILENREVKGTLHKPQILRDIALLLPLPIGHILYLYLLPLLRDPAVHRYCAGEGRRAGPLYLNPQTRVLRDLTADRAPSERALPLLMAEALGDPDRLLDYQDFSLGAGISPITFLGIYEGKGLHTTGDRKMVYPTLATLQHLAYAMGRNAEVLSEAVNIQRNLVPVIDQINARASAPFKMPYTLHLDVHENTDARKLREFAEQLDGGNPRHLFALYHIILRRTHFTEISYRELEALWNMPPPQIEQFEALEYTSAKAKGVAYRADRIERWIAHSLRLHGTEEIIIWILGRDRNNLAQICNHLDAQGLYPNIVAGLRPQIPPPLIRIEVVPERVKLSPLDEVQLQTRIEAQRERMQRLPSLLDGEVDFPALGEYPSMTRILVEAGDYGSAFDRAVRFIPNSTRQLFVEVDLSAERTRREILPIIAERHWPREIREVRVVALGGVTYIMDRTTPGQWQCAEIESKAWQAATPEGRHRLILKATWAPPKTLYGLPISLDSNASGAIRGLPDLLVEIRQRLMLGRPLPQGELARRIQAVNDGAEPEGSQGMISKIEAGRTTDLPSLHFLVALARIAPANHGQANEQGLDPRDVEYIAMLPKLRDKKVRTAALASPEGPTYYGRTRGTFEKLANDPAGSLGISWVVYRALRDIDRPFDVDAYAERSGMGRTSLGSLLGTTDQPTLATIDRLAYYLGWPRERLIVAINYQRGLMPLIDAINDAGFPMEYSLLIGSNRGGDLEELRRFVELGAQYPTDVRYRLALNHWVLRRQVYIDRTAGDLAEAWSLTPRQLEQLESPVWAGPYEGGIRFDAENLPRFIAHSLRLGRALEEVAEDLSPTLERAEEMVAWLESEKVYPELVLAIRARIEAMRTPPATQDRLTKTRKGPRSEHDQDHPTPNLSRDTRKNPRRNNTRPPEATHAETVRDVHEQDAEVIYTPESRDKNFLRSLLMDGKDYAAIPIPQRLAYEKEIFRIIADHAPEHPLALLAKEVLARTHWALLMQEARRKIRRVREGAAIDVEDLAQEAAAVLLKSAIPKFDPTLNNLFSTYLRGWSKQAQRRHIDDLARTIRVPVHRHEIFQYVRILLREGKTDPEICDFLEISAGKLKEIKSQMYDNTVSADAPRRLGNDGNDNESNLYDVLSSAETPSPDHETEGDERRELIQQAIDQLKPQQAEVLRSRFWGEETLEQTGTHTSGHNADGVTRERVRQIEKEALQRLKQILIRRFKLQPEDVLDILGGRLPALVVGFGTLLVGDFIPSVSDAQPLHPNASSTSTPSWIDTWTSPGHLLLAAAALMFIPTVLALYSAWQRNSQNSTRESPPSSGPSQRRGGLWRN